MGIQIEFNPDLALRNISEFESGARKQEECLPARLERAKEYHFLKKGQRNYWLHGEIALLETKGNEILSKPIASIVITSCTHRLVDGEVWTEGNYTVTEAFADDKVHFEWLKKVSE